MVGAGHARPARVWRAQRRWVSGGRNISHPYPAGLTAAQVAQRVQASYHYDNNSFSSEADRDDYIRRQLQNEISDEYADRHDGAYPDEKYLNEETERRLAERTGMATPESAQA